MHSHQHRIQFTSVKTKIKMAERITSYVCAVSDRHAHKAQYMGPVIESIVQKCTIIATLLAAYQGIRHPFSQ